MEALTLLLMFFVVSGHSHVLHPRLTITERAGLDSYTDHWTEWRTEKPREISISAEERGNEETHKKEEAATSTEEKKIEEEQWKEGLTPETDLEKRRMAGFTKTGDTEKTLDRNQGYEIISTERLTPETLSENKSLEDETKREEDATVADTADGLIDEHLDTDQEGEVAEIEDGLNPDTNSEKTEKLEENRKMKEILGDNTESQMIVKTVSGHNTGIQEKRGDGQTDTEVMKSGQIETEKQSIEKEEVESKLVAGIGLDVDSREDHHENGEKHFIEKQGNVEENSNGKNVAEEGKEIINAEQNKLAEREKEDRLVISNLTLPLGTVSAHVETEIATPATPQFTTQAQIPASSSPSAHHYNVPPLPPVLPPVPPVLPSHPPSPFTKLIPQFSVPSVTLPAATSANHIFALTIGHAQTPAAEVESVSLVADFLTEVFKVTESPGHHLKQNPLEVKVGPTAKVSISSKKAEDVRVKNIAVPKKLQTTHQIKDTKETNTIIEPKETELIAKEFTAKEQEATPKPKQVKFITENLKATPKLQQPKPTPRLKENNSTAKLVKSTPKTKLSKPTGKPKLFKPMENETKPTVNKNKASPPKPQVTQSSAKPPLTGSTGKTPAKKPTKINKSNKNKKSKKSKGKTGKKGNKAKKPSEERVEVTTPTYFPYFKDNYCPPECACYGRVVQCSDKGVDKVPYGIPYNARYILLMNNHINSIQLDLLNEYTSMEFLVLSNNRLTDGTIEGAFERVPALKRLYLDSNLLESVPTDLPASLEELRLDNNRLGVMSEAAWTRCPHLLVLSLSNNSLGNGSESLPDAVLSPLGSLRTLNLDHNQLASVPLGLPLSIKELYLRGNLIQRFRGGAFNGTSELVVLDLSANKLTNKGLLRESLLNATHLESLNLEGNRLKQVPRHLPLSLKTLNLEGNLISSINKATFLTLPNLEHLGLARNKIFRVAPGAFRTLPVLHQLDLCHNALRQVPRQLPRGLHSAALTHNKIQSVPRDAFCWGAKTPALSQLVRVQLQHNLIDLGNLDAQAFRCLRGFQVVHFY